MSPKPDIDTGVSLVLYVSKLEFNIYIFIVFHCRSTICHFFFFIFHLHAIRNEAMESANKTHRPKKKKKRERNQPQISSEQYHTVKNMQTLITFGGLFHQIGFRIRNQKALNSLSQRMANMHKHIHIHILYTFHKIHRWSGQKKSTNLLYSCSAFDACNIIQDIQFR